LNCAVAAAVLPGISDATLIVTALDAAAELLFATALEAEPAHTASRLATLTATAMALRVDFIVLSLSFCTGSPRCGSMFTYSNSFAWRSQTVVS
jgi:hypothetical protein